MLTSLNAEFSTYKNFITFKCNFELDFFSLQEFLRTHESQNIIPS